MELFLRHTLLFGSDDIEGKDGENGTVHGHGDGHLAEVDLVEKNLHVEDAVDGHTGFTHIAHHTLVVGVVTAVGCEVEGAAKTFLTSGDITAIEGVGLFSGREACILADSPGAHDIHGAVWATEEGDNTGGIVEMLHAFEVNMAVNRLDVDLLGGLPVLLNVIVFLPLFKGLVAILLGLEVYF